MLRQLLTTILLFGILGTSYAQTPTTQELEEQKAALKAQINERNSEIGTLNAELNAIEQELAVRDGWLTGLTGLLGFNMNRSNDWIASPNPNALSTGLNIGLTAFANQENRRSFWRNKGVLSMAWNDVDLSAADDTLRNDGLFDNGTVDILNLSSLLGYKLNDWIALSGLGEANTSVGNFFQPGTIDIGVGATLTPITNLVVVLHPLNYHLAFSGVDNVESQGGLGTKFRADYTRDFSVGSKKIAWSSTLTGFAPYGGKVQQIDGDPTSEVSLFNYTWLNTLSFEIWKGLGVGTSLGVRQSEFEFDGTQSFYSLGLTYSL